MNKGVALVGGVGLGAPGAANKLNKRSEVLQATDARQNVGSAADEDAAVSSRNPKRKKAGR